MPPGDAAEALSSQAALVELRRGQIAAAETEMKRAKATAALIAAKLKDITSKLTDLRAKVGYHVESSEGSTDSRQRLSVFLRACFCYFAA